MANNTIFIQQESGSTDGTGAAARFHYPGCAT
jgi:hypothetical protein